MARMGDGDKRWIVEDRPDGTNVHNWHWAETDCLDWSRNFLSNLLSNKPILSGDDNLYLRTKTLQKCDGEAYVNVRKGKIIPGYELNLILTYEAEARDSDGTSVILSTEGSVEIPYISDENAGEDPEIKITIKDEGPIGRRLKDAFIAKGKPFVLEKVGEYVDVMAKGGPAKEELEVKKVGVKKPSSAAGTASNVGDNSGNNRDSSVKESKKKEKRKEGFKTIKMSEKFSCRARDLYEILMDENRWKGFSQSNARISKEVGGEFSIFDGSVTGTNVELQEAKLIIQNWRFGSWPDGIVSKVCLTFEEPEPGVTVVKLTHTDVPEEDRYGNSTVVENTERGWRDLIFHRIRAVFGFGI
ncbi:Aha1 domain-containing protein [Forsythia ovata]|uniref:Aha1 domain-containing protein n=1 Tax=Forsythia ovata TaxID=205694 RepID=A0ABD1SPD0_9LAMI